MVSLSIIIPAYNEERRIGKTLDSYSKHFEYLRKVAGLDSEIIVVINNTTDNTEEVVKASQKNNSRIRYLNLPGAGKGYAIIEGFKEALKRKVDFIGYVDADMATKPEDFYDLIRNIGNHGGVIASRYMKGSVIDPRPTVTRLIAKRMFNMWIRGWLLLPYRDTQCGAKLFSRNAIEAVISELTMSQWAFDVDLLYTLNKKGFKILEIPTKWSDKEYSTINFWQAGPFMALGVVRLRVLNSPFKGIMRLYDKFLGFIPK